MAALLVIGWMYRRLARLYPGLCLHFRVRDWPEIAREALPLSLASLLGSVYLNGGVLLLGWLSNSGSAALFLVAQKVMLTLAILVQVINKAAFPAISSLQLLLMALPRPGSVLFARIVGAAALISLSILLIPRMDAAGAALALAVAEAVSTTVLFLLVRRAAGGVPWNLRCFAPLAAGAAGAWPILLKLPLAALLYTGLVLLLGGMSLQELRSLPLLLLSVARGETSAQQLSQQSSVEPGAEQLHERQP